MIVVKYEKSMFFPLPVTFVKITTCLVMVYGL